MSLYKDATLAMIPTAYKDGKLYSVRPTDGSGDFTFSRGTTATRVASSGYIEKGRENLLLQSNTFDTTWTLNNASVTGGQAGYDGSSDAWLLTALSTSNCRVNQTIGGSGVQSISIYAKANTSNFLAINAIVSITNALAYFDLANGVVGTTNSAVIDANIESIGAGWYRCSVVYNDTNTQMRFLIADGDGSTAVTNGNSIYIQDAQLEAGLVATDYIETGASTAQAGILEDMPRLDYSGGASCPALLLEPQRTNLIVQSEGFATTAWTDNATNANVTANATRSPEGLQNAAEIEFTSSSAKIYDQFTNVASSLHIGSVWLKNKNIGSIRVRIEGGAPNILGRVDVNLANGTLSNAVGDFTPTIEDYGDGWYRVAVGDTGTATIALPSFSFDYLSSTGSFYAYGAQVETGSYPTSYIPTYGASVTRSADSCLKTSASSLIGQTEGSILVEIDVKDKTLGSSWAFSLNDGTTSNYIGLRRSGSSEFLVHINVGGSTTALISTGINEGIHKIGIAYANDDISVYVDGSSAGTDTSSGIPTMSVIELGDLVSNRYLDDKIKQFVLFPTRLTDTELASLTTL